MRKEVTFKEQRTIQLDILSRIHDFCKANRLRYSLCGGTLLGAVRHKGYIPWDDDIDIFMPRPDYERFLTTFLDSGGIYKVQHYGNDDSYPLRWARVRDDRTLLISTNNVSGVFVDVFPIDGLPEINEIGPYVKKLKKLQVQLAYTTNYNKVLSRYSSLIFRIKQLIKRIIYPSRQDVIADYDRLFHSYEFDESCYAGAIVSRFCERELLNASVYKKYIELPFEGRMFCCISDYDSYLKRLYGNYMELPPIEQRVTHHRFKIYWK